MNERRIAAEARARRLERRRKGWGQGNTPESRIMFACSMLPDEDVEQHLRQEFEIEELTREEWHEWTER